MRDTGHRTPMQGGMGYCAGGRGTSYQAGRLEMIRGPGDTTVKTHTHAGWGMRDIGYPVRGRTVYFGVPIQCIGTPESGNHQKSRTLHLNSSERHNQIQATPRQG